MDRSDYCSTSEASQMMMCSSFHVRTLIRQKKLPCYRVGNRAYIPRTAIQDYINKQVSAEKTQEKVQTENVDIDLRLTGSNIRNFRRKHKLSAADIADYLHLCSPRAVYRWERGECLPSVDNLVLLAHLYSVPIDALVVLADIGRQEEKATN